MKSPAEGQPSALQMPCIEHPGRMIKDRRYCENMMMLCDSQEHLWRLILTQLKTVEALHTAEVEWFHRWLSSRSLQSLPHFNASSSDGPMPITSSILVQVRQPQSTVSTAGRGEVQGSNNTTGSLGGLNRRRCSSDAAVHQNHRHQQQQQQQRDVDADRRAMEAGAEIRRRLSMILRVFFLAFVLDLSINGYYLILVMSILYLMRLDELMKRVWQARGAPGAAIGARPSLDVQLNRLDRLRERRAKRDELIEQEKEKRAAAVREKIQERGEITDETGIEMQVYEELYGSSPTPEEIIDASLRPQHKKDIVARFVYQLPVMFVLTIIPEWSPNPDYLT